MRKLVLLVGEPGSGKTTIVRRVREHLAGYGKTYDHGWKDAAKATLYFPHLVGVVGRFDGRTYEGTDALALHAYPQVIEMIKELPSYGWLIEGDRYATYDFIDTMQKHGVVTVLGLVVGPKTLEARRAARASKKMNATWLAGRRTKFLELATRADTLYSHHTPADTEKIVARIMAELEVTSYVPVDAEVSA